MTEGRAAPGDAAGDHGRPGRLFWPAVAVGGLVTAVGVWGLLNDTASTHPDEAARFVLGAALVHDLLLAPVVVLLGWGAAPLSPRPARGPVQAALVVSAVVTLFSVPFVRGYGRGPTNPSILPRNYASGLAITVAAVWVVAAAAVALRWWRRRPPKPAA